MRNWRKPPVATSQRLGGRYELAGAAENFQSHGGLQGVCFPARAQSTYPRAARFITCQAAVGAMSAAIAAAGLLVGFVVALLAPPGWEWGGGVIAFVAIILAIWRGEKDHPLW